MIEFNLNNRHFLICFVHVDIAREKTFTIGFHANRVYRGSWGIGPSPTASDARYRAEARMIVPQGHLGLIPDP